MNELARTLVKIRRFADADRLLEELIELYRSIDYENYATYSLSAIAKAELGRLDEAVTLQLRLLSWAVKVQGIDSDTAEGARANLSVTLKRLGEFDKRAKLGAEIVAAQFRKYGEADLKSGLALSSLAEMKADLRDYGSAVDLQRRSIAIIECSVGADAPEAIGQGINLAYFLLENGEERAAVEQIEAVRRNVKESSRCTKRTRRQIEATRDLILRLSGYTTRRHRVSEWYSHLVARDLGLSDPFHQ